MCTYMILIISNFFRGAPIEMAIIHDCQSPAGACYWKSDHFNMLAKKLVKISRIKTNTRIKNVDCWENFKIDKNYDKMMNSHCSLTLLLLSLFSETSLTLLDLTRFRPLSKSPDLGSRAGLWSGFLFNGGLWYYCSLGGSQWRLGRTLLGLCAIINTRHLAYSSFTLSASGHNDSSLLLVDLLLGHHGIDISVLRLAYRALGWRLPDFLLWTHKFFAGFRLDIRDLGRWTDVVILHSSSHTSQLAAARTGLMTLARSDSSPTSLTSLLAAARTSLMTPARPDSSPTTRCSSDGNVIGHSDTCSRCVIYTNLICQIDIAHYSTLINDASLNMTDHRYPENSYLYDISSCYPTRPTPTHIVEGVVYL